MGEEVAERTVGRVRVPYFCFWGELWFSCSILATYLLGMYWDMNSPSARRSNHRGRTPRLTMLMITTLGVILPQSPRFFVKVALLTQSEALVEACTFLAIDRASPNRAIKTRFNSNMILNISIEITTYVK